MAEFGAAGAGLRDEDRRALKEGKKLLKKALGAAGVLKGGKHKEKLRREKQRRRDEEQARAQCEAREVAARRAELHQRATAAAAERRRQAAEREQRAATERERRQAAETERERRGRQQAEREREEERAAAQRAREEDLARLEAEAAEREAAGRAAFAATRAEVEGDFKSLAAERALSARVAEDAEALRSAIEAERAAARARAQQEVEERRRHQRELDLAREAAQAYARDVETELADARAVAARTQEFYETERGEREAAERRRQAVEEAAQRRERDLREQIRKVERELEEHEGGGFEDVCGLFSGVTGGVAARARGAALRKAKQELEQRRAELAVVVAQKADRERHVDAAQAEAAARTAAADAALRERDAATAEAERNRARWYAASFEVQTAEKHAQNTIDLKNLELREEVKRNNAMKTELEYEAEKKAAMDVELGQASLRERLAEAKLQDTVAELSRLKAELQQARSTAAPVGDAGDGQCARDRGVEELLADLNKLDGAVSSLLANKNKLKNEVWRALSRAKAETDGHPIEYAMKAVEEDFEDMCKVIQEVRARVRTLEPPRLTEAALQVNKLDEIVPSLLANINEVEKYMQYYQARPQCYPSEYALDDVRKDFKRVCKVIQEFRAHVHMLNPSGSMVEAPSAPVGLRVADVNDIGVKLEWRNAEGEDHPASGFDVQYKPCEQIQWEDLDVASPQRVSGVPGLRCRHGGGFNVLPTGATKACTW